MGRLELEELGYRFEVDHHQCKVRFRPDLRPTALPVLYKEVFFDSWPRRLPLPVVWGLALAEAQRDLVARRLS